MRDYLRTLAQEVPDWLMRVDQNSQFNCQDFFNSRVVFYPGSGDDGHPVSVFGGTRSAHCFVYADYGMSRQSLERCLHEWGFRGYHNMARLTVRQEQIVPHGWSQHAESITEIRAANAYEYAREVGALFAFLEVLERDSNFDDHHGGKRLAILFIAADGIAAFDAMFCQSSSAPLFALVLQDHGFGGNYTTFGEGGSLDQIALKTKTKPEYLLCADGTRLWNGYSVVSGTTGEIEPRRRNMRLLYKRATRD